VVETVSSQTSTVDLTLDSGCSGLSITSTDLAPRYLSNFPERNDVSLVFTSISRYTVPVGGDLWSPHVLHQTSPVSMALQFSEPSTNIADTHVTGASLPSGSVGNKGTLVVATLTPGMERPGTRSGQHSTVHIPVSRSVQNDRSAPVHKVMRVPHINHPVPSTTSHSVSVDRSASKVVDRYPPPVDVAVTNVASPTTHWSTMVCPRLATVVDDSPPSPISDIPIPHGETPPNPNNPTPLESPINK